MSNLVGENYGDNHSEEEAPKQQGVGPGEGKNDEPATTGTHRGWGDPQPDEENQSSS
jgi:hypothetical protein